MNQLKNKLSDLEIKKIVNAKLLYQFGNRFIENEEIHQIYNLSIVLYANALEIVLYVLAKLIYSDDKSKDFVSKILDDFEKKEKLKLQYTDIRRIINARNDIYHRADYRTYTTCKELKDITLNCLRNICENYFGIKWDALSMTDLISDEGIKGSLKEAETYLNEGDYNESIRNTCTAFANFETRISKRDYRQVDKMFLKTWSSNKISWTRLQRLITMEGIHKDPNLDLFSSHIENQVNKKFKEFSKKINFITMLGKHYEDYKHFISIIPLYHISISGSVRFNEEKLSEREFTRDEAEFCYNFVQEAILEIEPKLKPVEIKSISGNVLQVIK
jgi:hypothetical protein